MFEMKASIILVFDLQTIGEKEGSTSRAGSAILPTRPVEIVIRFSRHS